MRRTGLARPATASAHAATAAALVAAARLAAHRVALAETVRQASPLLLDALAARGIALGGVLDRLEPVSGDPTAHFLRHVPTAASAYYRKRAPGAAPWLSGEPSAPLTATPGEGLRLVRIGRCLGLGGTAGRLRIATAGATAWLWIEDIVPATLALAIVGRPVDALISHPLLDGRDYETLRAEPGGSGRPGTALQVRTGLRRCRPPWTPQEALAEGAAALAGIMAGAGLAPAPADAMS